MTLYRMELYRILHRKILWVLFGVMLVWLAFYFDISAVAGEHCKVNQRLYYGYDAIKMDRKITEEFKGVLTDVDVSRIIKRYGFPHEVKADYGDWQDKNYLNGFVTEYLSDGYFYSWDDYRVAQNVLYLADSALRNYVAGTGDGVDFGYAKGWENFLEISQMSSWFMSVWLIIALSPLFCEEKQNRMRPLIFTSEKGPDVDTKARIAAAFTVSIVLFLALILLLFLVCGAIFGYDGGTMKTGILLHMREFYRFSQWDIRSFTGLYIFTGFCAMLMLTAVVIWVSSKVDSPVHSMAISVLFWAVPMVLLLTFRGRGIYFLAVFQQVFLTNYTCMVEAGSMYLLRIGVSGAIAVSGVICSFRIWRKLERE